jgi:hypothetical protein
MKSRPGTNQGDLCPRKVALDDFEIVDPHLRLAPGGAGKRANCDCLPRAL